MKKYVYPVCQIVFLEETDLLTISGTTQLEDEDYVVLDPEIYH